MIFKIYNCDFGIVVNGTSYLFEHVASLTVDDPERNELTRGNNASNETGVAYRSGLSEPKTWTIPILNMSAALKTLLDSCFKNQTRLDVFAVDRSEGSKKSADNAILANRPQQLTIDDSAESMQVSLEFKTFSSTEVHKS